MRWDALRSPRLKMMARVRIWRGDRALHSLAGAFMVYCLTAREHGDGDKNEQDG